MGPFLGTFVIVNVLLFLMFLCKILLYGNGQIDKTKDWTKICLKFVIPPAFRMEEKLDEN
jgi:hypothetical protein